MAISRYVKFMRGTQALYNSLTTKDNDTLYFVYENADAEKGKLYLGNKLISGSSSIDGNISISDIDDIVIGAGLSDGDVLVYNEATQKWEATPISVAIGVDIMGGATATADGTAGLVPVPIAGDQLKYLRGDGTWATVVAELSAQDQQTISDLQTVTSTLVGDDTGKSVAEIVAQQVAELLIPENANESLDTLQEIAQWIQDHPDDASAMNDSITVLQTKVGDLENLLNGTNGEDGLVNKVENLEDSVSALQTTVGTFVAVPDSYSDIGSAISYLNDSVTTINDRLRWHELSEE